MEKVASFFHKKGFRGHLGPTMLTSVFRELCFKEKPGEKLPYLDEDSLPGLLPLYRMSKVVFNFFIIYFFIRMLQIKGFRPLGLQSGVVDWGGVSAVAAELFSVKFCISRPYSFFQNS